MNKFYIEDPYSSNPKVYQYPVDGIDDGALVVVELGPVLKLIDQILQIATDLNTYREGTESYEEAELELTRLKGLVDEVRPVIAVLP